MYARILTLNLKPKHLNSFKETLDKQVLPTLRKQNGFKDEISFVDPSETEIRSITFWDKKENADLYGTAAYPEVLKALASVLEGSPEIKTYEVMNSTVYKIPTLATV